MAYTYGSETNCKVRNGQTRSEYKCRLGYEVQSQSIANNTSSVKLRLECKSTNAEYQTKGPSGLTTVIDGTTIKNNAAVDMSNENVWQNFGEKTITVTHNANGTYSASKSGSFTCTAGSSNYSLSSGSASVTVSPKDIPRYATSNQSLYSRSSSSITMSWSSDSTIDYVWYSKDNGASWVAVGSVNATSGSYTISGLSSNTTYNIKTRVRRKDSQLTTDSSVLSISTYATTVASIYIGSKGSTWISVGSNCNVSISSTGYRIRTASGSWSSWQSSGAFEGLSPNTTYVVQVYKTASESGETGYADITVATYPRTTPSIWLNSKTINSISVGSNCNVSYSQMYYDINKNGTYIASSNNENFTGLSPYTTYVLKAWYKGSDSGEWGVAELSVTTYDYAKITSCTDFNLGDNTSISYSNPSGSTVNISIYLPDGATELAGYRDSSGGTYTFNFTDTELDTMYKKMSTANTLTGRFYLKTTCNGTNYYHSIDKTITLKGNQKTAHIGVNGVQKRAKVFMGVNGSVKRAVIWIGNNGGKRCI